MSRFLVTPLAERDLEEVVDYIATETGADQAGAVLDDLVESMEHLATSPRMGHRRADLTDEDVRFWIAHRYLIVYRPETRPVEVVRVLHGARDPRTLREAIDE